MNKDEPVRLKTGVLNDKSIAYGSCTEFLVQLSKGKGAYKTVASFIGNLAGAVIHYNGLNVHSGHNKRLLMPSCSHKPVLARERTT